jgi:hypothetical protein
LYWVVRKLLWGGEILAKTVMTETRSASTENTPGREYSAKARMSLGVHGIVPRPGGQVAEVDREATSYNLAGQERKLQFVLSV